jgi:flagellar motility protein MotE (MotC chaperone)
MTNGQTRKRAALSLAAVFVAGAVLGIAATSFYAGRLDSRSILSPHEYRAQLLEKLTKDLGLDEGQQQQVEVILDEIGERFRSVREAIEPELEAIRGERADRIMSLLDQGQRAKYVTILEERERRRKEHAARHPTRGGRQRH